MTMKKIYTLYQTNNPNTLGGYMTYSTLSEALDTIGQIGFNGMLIDTITAVTMVDSELVAWPSDRARVRDTFARSYL